MAHWFAALGDQWKAVIALAGAAGVGGAGVAYLTLPRTVAEIQEVQQHQQEVLLRLEDAVQHNTRAILLVSCTQAATLIDNKEESQISLHACIATYGLGSAETDG